MVDVSANRENEKYNMKQYIFICLIVMLHLRLNGQDTLRIGDFNICFCEGFNKDSVSIKINNELIFSGIISDRDDTEKKIVIDFDTFSETDISIILYKNQNTLKELRNNTALPPKYLLSPSINFFLKINKNPPPKFIYFEGLIDYFNFFMTNEEIIYRH
jgi:hypothetical protein